MKEKLLLIIAVLSLLAGCETAYTPSGSEASSQSYYPTITDVPPSFYHSNPSLSDWYTFPYWNPDAD